MCYCGNSGCGGCGALTVPEGPTGPVGPVGAAGAAGADGTDGADGPTWMSWTLSRGTDTPFLLGGGAGVFRVAAEQIYPGSVTVTPPTYVKIGCEGLVATANFDLQLYDATNSVILAQALANSNINYSTVSLTVTAAASWPVGEARLQIRCRDNQAASNEVGLYSMTWHN